MNRYISEQSTSKSAKNGNPRRNNLGNIGNQENKDNKCKICTELKMKKNNHDGYHCIYNPMAEKFKDNAGVWKKIKNITVWGMKFDKDNWEKTEKGRYRYTGRRNSRRNRNNAGNESKETSSEEKSSNEEKISNEEATD